MPTTCLLWRGAAVFVAAVSAAGLSGWATAATDSEAPSKTIDRTLLCSTQADALGKRTLGITVMPKSAQSRPTISILALGPDNDDHKGLVGVSAPGVWIGGPGLRLHRVACRTTSRRIQLSSKGLPGPPTEFLTSDKCAVGRRVVIRIQAVLSSWKGWSIESSNSDEPRRRDIDFAHGVPVHVSVAVRTDPARRPIAFATLDGQGRSKFWAAGWPRCGLP